jgi:acyl-ACP thioesterase
MSFSSAQQVRLGDVTTQGRLRLDAVARYLQDIAVDDAAQAHLPDGRGWILRRMTFDIGRLPTIYEELVLETFPTGVGGRWAERTTTLVGIDGLNAERTALKSGVLVTAAAIWVYVRLDTGAPVALPPEFFVAYGEQVRERKVSARLIHPAPPAGEPRVEFPLRGTDFDVFGHVNNAIYWVPVEDFMAAHGSGRRPVNASIEFGTGIQPGERCEVITMASETDAQMWFLVGDEVRASIQVEFAP